jgi:hypothetical protein
MNKKKAVLQRVITEEEKIAKVLSSQKEDMALLINTLKVAGEASQSTTENLLDRKSKETELLVQTLKEAVVEGNKEDTLTPQILLQTVKQLDVLEKSILGMIVSIQDSNKEVAKAISESNLKLVDSIEKTRKTDYKMKINRAGGSINEITIKADV